MFSGIVPTVVVASNALAREGLRSHLAGSRFATVPDAGPPAGERAPQLIVAMLDDPRGVETARAHRAAWPEARLVLFTGAGLPPGDLCGAAHGILDCAVEPETLVRALDLVMEGVAVLTPGLLGRLAANAGPTPARPAEAAPQAGAPTAPLSTSEVKVLRCLAGGASNKMIALRYALAEPTVKIHVKNILRKLKAQNRTQAAIWARENGLHPL
ncbi:LuxR C-terminal-related transcriptional regulator [Methylobacterium durans]|uniref:DNA-binding response regulator n=1 Tax=Methylobacterium durans TaxID=2202825 RepID=A0A2U8WE01_9HYPH|nr:response regulator transcription factor [Methylobacterium durans]AWN43680.1 DNA-binding response regulator [Methylobacterium durans]